MKEKLLKIINFFGINNQQRKLMEEVYELQEAIIRYEDGKDIKDHIIEELADCMVLLHQIKEYYKLDNEDVKAVMIDKVERTIQRMQ